MTADILLTLATDAALAFNLGVALWSWGRVRHWRREERRQMQVWADREQEQYVRWQESTRRMQAQYQDAMRDLHAPCRDDDHRNGH